MLNWKGKEGKRAFRPSWLETYSPRLVYSAKEKGAFCLFCVLFPQPVNRGFQGVFITPACKKYNDFNNIAKDHMKSGWHKGSISDAENFQKIKKFPSKQITSQLDLALKNKIEENRPILSNK